jgi:NAD(P)-dependent dehydrogenase (short-subunit alcohol dehydrogenase family)
MPEVSDKIDLTGRVAVVTGAGGGLGSEYCRALAARGAAVVVNDLGGDTKGEGSSTSFADKVVDEIRAAGGKAVANYDTVGTEAGGAAIIRAATDHFGRIDIVVNNAGNQRNVKFGELTEDDIEAVYAVHVKGAFFVTQPAYRQMCQQKYGRIILVSSQSGIFGNPIRGNYGSAKTAMIGLMNVIAQEAPAGVTVNCLFPNARGGRLGGKPGDVRPDADFLAAAGARTMHYIDGMDPSFVAALVTYMSSELCNTSQNMYSVLGGKYSRIFIGLTEGWYKPGKTAPTPEEILAHLPQIDDRGSYAIPLSGLEEMDTVLAARKKLGLGA